MEELHGNTIKKDHPGVYVPPPMIYVAFFFLSVYFQKVWPTEPILQETVLIEIAGYAFLIGGVALLIPAVIRFVRSRNTLIPIKPANSLQTTGVYRFTRNPMYLALLLIYIAMAFLKGSLWTLLLAPAVIALVQIYVIRREEQYLSYRFPTEFPVYRTKVRRWL
jgi:protein-S-isoprenylcysteine O-methyltransferase Ste14